MSFLALTAGSAALGAAKAAGTVVPGVAQAIGARDIFTSADQRELRETNQRLERLRQRRRQGDLGLTDPNRQRIENRQAVERGGMLRTSQAQSDQAMQALANQNAVSGRDMFLAQMASQESEAQLRGAQAEAMAMQDMQARQEQIARIRSLEENRRRLQDLNKAEDQTRRAGLATAFGGLFLGAAGGAADVGIQRLQADEAVRQETKRMEAILEGSKDLTQKEVAILQTYNGAFGSRRQRVNSATGPY